MVIAPQVTMASQYSERLIPPCADWLHDGTRKVFPTMCAILFIIAGSVVIIYSLCNHQPVPPNFVIGIAITFGILITLIIIGNFFLYARIRMSLFRSASGSETSIRIEGERKHWYVRLRTLLDKIEDGPRSFIRDYALRKVSTRNSRSRVRHHDPDPTLSPIAQEDRSGSEIDLERGERLNQQTSSHELDNTVSRIEVAGGTKTAPRDTIDTIMRAEAPHRPRKQRHDVAASPRISGISTSAGLPPLSKIQDAFQGHSPQAEVEISKVKRSRKRSLLRPGKQFLEQHALFLMKHAGDTETREPTSFKVDSRISSGHSGVARIPLHSTQIHKGEGSSDTQVYHFKLPQQRSSYATSNPQVFYGTSNIGNSVADVDRMKASALDRQDACHSRSDCVTIGFHEISISNTSPCAALMQKSGNTRYLREITNCAKDVPLGHTTSTNDSYSLASPAKACYQVPPTTSSSSPELAPKLPEIERGSAASGFTRRLLESISLD